MGYSKVIQTSDTYSRSNELKARKQLLVKLSKISTRRDTQARKSVVNNVLSKNQQGESFKCQRRHAINGCRELLRNKNDEIKSIEKSIMQDGRFQMINGWIEPMVEVKETSDLKSSLKSFVTPKVEDSSSVLLADNGAFSCWMPNKSEKKIVKEEMEPLKKSINYADKKSVVQSSLRNFADKTTRDRRAHSSLARSA